MIYKFIKRAAPVAIIAMSTALAGCGDMNININGDEGVPLAELDISGDTPTELVLAGPDKVVLTSGDALTIDVAGDDEAINLLRFTNEDGTLGIMRANGKWSDSGTAIVTVTMPAPTAITIAGSGSAEAETVASDADLTIAGSGSLSISNVDVTKIDATIAGAGSLSAAGNVEKLDLNVLGSGSGDMADLLVNVADITIAGSGDARFASDGEVAATIMGSGSVTVTGSATCEVETMGSGSLNCEGGTKNAAEGESAEEA